MVFFPWLTLLSHCSYTALTLLWHCSDTALTLLSHCSDFALTLLSHCSYIAFTPFWKLSFLGVIFVLFDYTIRSQGSRHNFQSCGLVRVERKRSRHLQGMCLEGMVIDVHIPWTHVTHTYAHMHKCMHTQIYLQSRRQVMYRMWTFCGCVVLTVSLL
jgi:hypothetical protein